jgi:hypothetical protein
MTTSTLQFFSSCVKQLDSQAVWQQSVFTAACNVCFSSTASLQMCCSLVPGFVGYLKVALLPVVFAIFMG